SSMRRTQFSSESSVKSLGMSLIHRYSTLLIKQLMKWLMKTIGFVSDQMVIDQGTMREMHSI
ncbi:hypothetical protein, partial [Halorubrum sp. SP3]|uniref:hypothetical protein n=1 Tax=Halorubrum sp. SP3 TaxID=1537265 RepID=UPI001A7E068E